MPSSVAFAFLICLIMVVSGFAALPSAAQPSGGGGASDASDGVLQDGTPLRTRAWDWGALASEDGLVDVIVVLPDEEPVSVFLARWSCQAGEDRPARSFSSCLNGFTASLTVDEISRLSLLSPGAVLYPDLSVQATITQNIDRVGADDVWKSTDTSGVFVTGEGIVVAVIDTGIDYTHPDLGGGLGPAYKVIGGYDFINGDSDPMDDNGHGTHVAGVVAADGDIPGVAPSAKLLAYKVLGADGSGSMSYVISAIDAALDPNGDGYTGDHADIISMSLGGAGDSDDPVCLAVEEAISLGVVVVIAAGNEGPSLGTVASPGLTEDAITVGAVDGNGLVANFSSRGPVEGLLMKPEISAPGVQIVSTVPYSGTRYCSSTGYMAMSGTSMATPHVSGAAALILQSHPDWTPQMVKSALVSGSEDRGEPHWMGGAGELWVPGSIASKLFSSTPFVSYGLAGAASVTITVSNPGAATSVTLYADDWLSLEADGTKATVVETSLSTVSPPSLSLSYGSTGSFTLTVSGAVTSVPEGYYDGEVILLTATSTHRIPFGFVVMSQLSVHVYNEAGAEVFDPYGGVFVYRCPDADVAMAKRGYLIPSPPATFLLPSGTYSVHALGHQMVYTYSDPYILSTTVTLDTMDDLEVALRMSDAHEMTLDLETEGGQPIYVKDFRMYVRHEGANNVSFDMTGSDYSIEGPELFSVPRTMTVHVSDTDAQVGLAVSGFSYTPAMWTFMELNWDHWFEYVSGLSTDFLFESTADLQYLLAWEFDGVDPSSSSVLTWDDGTATSYYTKYDIPGTIVDPWCNWGVHRSMGGDAAFFVRRDTDTSLNTFFSGMTRTTIVHGTFVELYYPRGIFEGFVERQYYSPDYDNLVRAATVSEIYLPDRNFLSPIGPGTVNETVGSGPYYASVYTANGQDTMVLYHPLLRDGSGARVGGMSGPSMSIYRNSALVGMYQLSEFLARPDAVRYVDLFGEGSYTASIRYYPSSEVFDDVLIELGFAVPGTDVDPPRMTGMQLSQRFTPGESLPLSFSAADSGSAVMASVSWRPSGSTEWSSLSVQQSSDVFSTSVPTSSSTRGVDVKIELVDTSGNFLRYTAEHASLAEVPVVFTLTAVDATVRYGSAPDQVVLIGKLTDASGNPLSAVAAVPLELFVGGQKVGMVLDEYMTSTSHVHNGTIRFDWTVDPTLLFTGPNQTVEVRVPFDLGVYSSVEVGIELRSVFGVSTPPQLSLVSPSDGSLIAAGTPITLSVGDDGSVTFEYSVDGGDYQTMDAPYEIGTAGWSDGQHTLDVKVTDEDLNKVTASYSFEVDAASPVVSILTPLDGFDAPLGYTLEAEVSDAHLAGVTVSVDGESPVPFPSPYTIDMTSWSLGGHLVIVSAVDAVGHTSSDSVSFEILNTTLVLSVLSPADGSFIRSGTPISLYVLSPGTVTCTWSEDGLTHTLSHPYEIDTSGWGEGAHAITVGAADDLGSSAEVAVTVTVDDTLPVITLLSPEEGAFVTTQDSIAMTAYDLNFDRVVWSLNDFVGESQLADVSISLSYFVIDGYFTLEVSAWDKAGNVAEESVVFVMDSSAPEVSVTGVADGGAVSVDGSLEVAVADQFLSHVLYSLDSGTPVEAEQSFTVPMASLGLGWHVLEVVASDAGGHESSLSLSFYVDGTAPTIDIVSEDDYANGTDYVVAAAASDDFGVGTVWCEYEMDNGTVTQVAMTLAGGQYTATIPSSSLWDGMSVLVVAEDTVGNSAETPGMVLTLGGSDGPHSFLTSPLAVLAYVVALASVAVISLPVIRRRHSGVRPPAPADDPQSRPGPGEEHPSVQVVQAARGGLLSLGRAVFSAGGPSPPRTPGTGRDAGMILDAMSSLRVKLPEPPPHQLMAWDDPHFMCELELLSHSPVADALQPAPEAEAPWPDDSGDEGPVVVSGLEMKRLMEKGR